MLAFLAFVLTLLLGTVVQRVVAIVHRHTLSERNQTTTTLDIPPPST
jgi:hypothetical protein